MAGTSSMLNNILYKKKLSGKLVDYRSLQPICAALEVHSWKTALQLCSKLSRKQPNLYIVYALKSIALLGSMRPVSSSAEQEILSSLEYVKAHANGAGLADPDVLMVFGWVLSSIGRGYEINTMLSLATKLHPSNDDILAEAFLHYVRTADRKAAQQSSLRLAKVGKGDKYVWWSVMAIVMQVRRNSQPSDSNLLLSLAERQIATHFDQVRERCRISFPDDTAADAEDKGKSKAPEPDVHLEDSALTFQFESADEFHLVTRFLEARAEQDPSATSSIPLVLPSIPSAAASITTREALLAHFASSEGDKWCEQSLGLELWRRQVELQHGSLEGGNWIKSWDRLHHSLRNGDVNWHTMLYLIRCAFACADGSSAAFTEDAPALRPNATSDDRQRGADDLIERSHVLFRGLADDSEKGRLERGFLLAVLEIAQEGRRRELPHAKPLLPLIEDYFARFGTKMCCFDDLLPYLAVLDHNEATALHDKLSAETLNATDLSLKEVYRVINATKIARYLAPPYEEAAQVAIAAAELKRYLETLPIGKDLPTTDLQPADDFALLAAQAFVSAGTLSGDRSYFERALLVLEYGLSRSRHKYQLRILAINISRMLGASTLALSHYNVLNPKAIQNDTLSHLVLNRAATFATAGTSTSGSGDVLGSALSASAWYRAGEQEASEMVVRVFNFHKYSKIEDFAEFQERLSRSLNKYMIRIEALRIRLVRGELSADQVSEAKTQMEHLIRDRKEPLFDNRDFDTLPNLQARGQPGIWEQTSMGPKTSGDWLRAFVTIYSQMLNWESSGVEVANESASSNDLTASERNLLKFSSAARKALSASLDDMYSEQAALTFFKDQTTLISEALEKGSTLPWEILHIAQISLEGFLLLELAVEQRTAEITMAKPLDHPKLVKKIKAFRNAARDLTRTIGSKTIAHGKKVAKERARTITAVSSLKQFPQIDDDYVMSFSHALVDSRKVTIEALGQAMHRATQK